MEHKGKEMAENDASRSKGKRVRDPWKESTKKAVKSWVKEHVGSRGEDHILWGRWQIGDTQEGGTEKKRKKI